MCLRGEFEKFPPSLVQRSHFTYAAVSGGVVRSAAKFCGEFDMQRLENRSCDLILEIEEFVQATVKLINPYVVLGQGINQFYIDPQAIC